MSKKDRIRFNTVLSQSTDGTPVASLPAQDEETDRAWRKICHHQLDMTERDRQIIRDTRIPDWLIGQCYSGSLLK
ncbi:MAG TPA: hypothetical protein VMV94_08190 [Phycisphaerae bacterium]|nr:hypothetical protein [Phycisphaerae bacterium]